MIINKMVNIYVLELKNGKYYVGKTNRDIRDRFNEHLLGQGSEWTKKYKVIKVVEIIENQDNFDEDKITKKYMSIYGIDNVRGGSYVSINLMDYQIECLKKELNSSQDKCFKCGNYGHFANNCDIRHNDNIIKIKNDSRCYRCGRSGHYMNECYAEIDIDGDYCMD
jgi:predicted GIY-YIG superfamily endonuclease